MFISLITNEVKHLSFVGHLYFFFWSAYVFCSFFYWTVLLIYKLFIYVGHEPCVADVVFFVLFPFSSTFFLWTEELNFNIDNRVRGVEILVSALCVLWNFSLVTSCQLFSYIILQLYGFAVHLVSYTWSFVLFFKVVWVKDHFIFFIMDTQLSQHHFWKISHFPSTHSATSAIIRLPMCECVYYQTLF